MSTKLIFATNNAHKVKELQYAVGDRITIISLKDAGINQEIPEPFDTLEENAAEKARVIHALTGTSCFGEDTGLEVTALNGEPGVKSARYAGGNGNSDNNIAKLLDRLKDYENREARFRTVISVIWENEVVFFEGICNGHILKTKSGSSGFGYDPVFKPLGANRSFAEMSLAEKNMYSHRKKAADALVLFLQNRIDAL